MLTKRLHNESYNAIEFQFDGAMYLFAPNESKEVSYDAGVHLLKKIGSRNPNPAKGDPGFEGLVEMIPTKFERVGADGKVIRKKKMEGEEEAEAEEEPEQCKKCGKEFPNKRAVLSHRLSAKDH